MRVTIDDEKRSIEVNADGATRSVDLYSREGFELISRYWLRVGWNEKYPYTFSWMGRPVIQLPEDMIRTQEVIYRVKPDVIVETGVAHGGSLIFYASLFAAMGGGGRVVGVDIEIREANRAAIEAHPLSRAITLIEGSSTDPAVVESVRRSVGGATRVMVILDSNHSREHVAAELEAYAPMVTPGSYIVATDGIMEDVHMVPRAGSGWIKDNPSEAARQFAARHPEFVLEQPAWEFNESGLRANVTHWPDAWLRRL